MTEEQYKSANALFADLKHRESLLHSLKNCTRVQIKIVIPSNDEGTFNVYNMEKDSPSLKSIIAVVKSEIDEIKEKIKNL